MKNFHLVVVFYILVSTSCFQISKFLHRKSHSFFLRSNNEKNFEEENADSSAPFVESVQKAAEAIVNHKRFFFPGHSGGRKAPELNFNWNMDLPELDEIDSVHSPGGSLQRSLDLAAQLFGALRTWFLVNGSTSGILTAILATVKLHSQRSRRPASESILILGRDSHKSAFDAVQLAGCSAALLSCPVEPRFGIALGTTLLSVKCALDKHGDQVCGVLITRPSYQGVGCNSSALRELVDLCHSRGVPLIVDEAHGSHLRFLKLEQYQDAIACGADIVVQSTHKTLSSLSQTAMMHLGPNSFQFKYSIKVKETGLDWQQTAADLIQQYYSMLTTTSANALLLSSLDATRAHMAAHGPEMMRTSAAAVDKIRRRIRATDSFIRLLDDSLVLQRMGLVVDPMRLTVQFNGYNAQDIDDNMCEDDGIYCELNLEECITYAIPPGSTSDDLEPLAQSLLDQAKDKSHDVDIENSFNDSDLQNDKNSTPLSDVLWPLGAESDSSLLLPDSVSGLGLSAPISLPLSECVDTIAAETVCPYPPGIPVLIRGEQVSRATVDLLTSLRGDLGQGRTVAGVADQSLNTLRVYKVVTR